MTVRSRLVPVMVPLVGAALAATVLAGTALAGTAAAAPVAPAAANPFQRGPAPTVASISAVTGPFATATIAVPDSASPGFGSGTITYPTTTTAGKFGAVAVAPGFFGGEDSVAWYGPRLASQGFVVLTFNTNTLVDFPAPRGDELLSALDYLTTSSAVKARIDPKRLAVMGHSMGGGGTLEASLKRTTLKAAIGLAPFDFVKDFSGVRTPSLEVGGQNDTTAAPSQHAIPFYNSIPATVPKAYLEIAGADHLAPTKPNTTIAAASISWLKLYVDKDTRYRKFLCPGPLVGTTISGYKNTCTA